MTSLLMTIAVLDGAAAQQEASTTAPPEHRLLAAKYFYQNYHVGKSTPPTGLAGSQDGGRAWQAMTWPELISSSVAVGPQGRMIYLACGNGVLISRDAGQSWRLTGGWQMTEVQRVRIDARSHDRAWAATAYGLYSAQDLERQSSWVQTEEQAALGFCSDVIQERGTPERMWVATERGLYRSRDGGLSFELRGTPTRIRRVQQDFERDDHFYATSDGAGVLHSTDGGETWSSFEGSLPVNFCLTQSHEDPDILLVGGMGRVARSSDRGRSWQSYTAGIPDKYFVYDLVEDPNQSGRWIASGTSGLLESHDGGRSWSLLAMERAVVPDLLFARLARVPASGPSSEPGTIPALASNRNPLPFRAVPPTTPPSEAARVEREYRARRDLVEAGLRERQAELEPARIGFVPAILEYEADRVDAALESALWERLASPQHSMFFSLPLMGFYLHAGERLSAELRERIRAVMTQNPIYRGDTENHWVMHYAVLLLAAETWPETPASQWYMGRSSAEIHAEAKGWFRHWTRLTATQGQGEFDSPHYFFMYLAPLLLLYDFARDEEVQAMAALMLELLLADYASESLAGAYCGGHSRDPKVEQSGDNAVAIFHYLYAGGIPCPERISSWSILATRSRFRAPFVLEQIANERSQSYVHRERKRVRNVIRFGSERNPPVYKYTYVTPEYALGSLQGGVLQPIQQHTWDVSWKGRAGNSLFFAVHPFVSADELSLFFPEERQYLVESVSAQKSSYTDPDKLISSSPFERVFQHENTLLALYQVPESESFPHLNLYRPQGLEIEREGGWTFAREGEFFLAYFLSEETESIAKQGYDLLRCSARETGIVVVTSTASEWGADPFPQFRHTVLRSPLPRLERREDDLVWTYRRWDGLELSQRWSETGGRLNGEWVPATVEALFRGRFMWSEPDSLEILLTDGRHHRVLDFEQLEARWE